MEVAELGEENGQKGTRTRGHSLRGPTQAQSLYRVTTARGEHDRSALLYAPFPTLGPQPTSPPPTMSVQCECRRACHPTRPLLMFPAQPNTS